SRNTLLTKMIRAQKSAGKAPRSFLQNPFSRQLLADSGGAVLLLHDAGRFAAQVAQVIEFGATHLAATHHLDRVDHRGEDREHAFHALAIGNLAHGEALVDAATGAADADALIGLHAGAIAFHDLDIDDHGVAWREIGDVLLGGQFVVLLFFELLDEV